MYTYIHTYIHTYMHTCMHAHTQRTHTNKNMHTNKHFHTYTHTYTNMNTCIHTLIPQSSIILSVTFFIHRWCVNNSICPGQSKSTYFPARIRVQATFRTKVLESAFV